MRVLAPLTVGCVLSGAEHGLATVVIVPPTPASHQRIRRVCFAACAEHDRLAHSIPSQRQRRDAQRSQHQGGQSSDENVNLNGRTGGQREIENR